MTTNKIMFKDLYNLNPLLVESLHRDILKVLDTHSDKEKYKVGKNIKVSVTKSFDSGRVEFYIKFYKNNIIHKQLSLFENYISSFRYYDENGEPQFGKGFVYIGGSDDLLIIFTENKRVQTTYNKMMNMIYKHS